MENSRSISDDSGRAAVSEKPLLLFVHIGKTGGSTLASIVDRHYRHDQVLKVDRNTSLGPRERLLSLSEEKRQRLRLIRGHMVYGLHGSLGRPCSYFTMLREPTARVVSKYRQILRSTGHNLHVRVAEDRLSLAQCLSERISVEFDNWQVRTLCGDDSTPFGECNKDMLEMAKANLNDKFDVVGLTEKFDETLLLLRRVYGWTRLHYVPMKVTNSEHSPQPEATIATIRSLNQFDYRLYEYAAERIDSLIRTPHFDAELQKLRRRNQRMRWLAIAEREVERAKVRLSRHERHR